MVDTIESLECAIQMYGVNIDNNDNEDFGPVNMLFFFSTFSILQTLFLWISNLILINLYSILMAATTQCGILRIT